MISTHHQPTTAETEIGKWLIQIIGLTATVLVTIYVTRIAQKALQKSVDSN